ncbi:hypothetical protein SAMN05444158_4045 [Bradyrhizobium canariense]|uniref:Uncharacterized protein n=1 Tax=Bradyrhizobium canariense TaxID=255045 RepID=A0A1H1WWE4_9BRAD|nr:hypothetical protein SAMN05444158_4045 [Bradyrhizobium canariense]
MVPSEQVGSLCWPIAGHECGLQEYAYDNCRECIKYFAER